jgi:hypothetical protein
MIARRLLAILTVALGLATAGPGLARDGNGLLVLGTDFGLADGAVAAMKGVALGVDRGLVIHDLTHAVPPFDIWYGAYQLASTMPYWPAGTVFVMVVDPGVGTERGAVVARTGTGQFVVGPDNGLMTLVAESQGIAEVRRIDEARHRLPGSERSHTFHGRDVFAYAAAKLAAGVIDYPGIGPVLPGDVVRLAYTRAAVADGLATGTIPALDRNFGNVWTNIDRATFAGLGAAKGTMLEVAIAKAGKPVFTGRMPLVDTFGDVPEGAPLAYMNSDDKLAFALNYGDLATTHGIAAGPEWTVEVRVAR